MMKNYTKSQMDAIQDFLTVCIKNNYHCAHCARNHEGICFFAVQCFMNDMSYFDDGDDDCPCSGCFEDTCNNCTKGDIYYDC